MMMAQAGLLVASTSASECDVNGMTFHETAEKCCSALEEMSMHPECEDENSFDANCLRIVCDFCDGCSDSGDAQLQQATANCAMLEAYCPSSGVLEAVKLEKAQVSAAQSLFSPLKASSTEVASVSSDCDVGGMTFHDTAEQCCSALGEMSIHPECEDENSFDADCMRIVCDFCDGCSDSGDAQLQQATANCEMLKPYCPSSGVLAAGKVETAQMKAVFSSVKVATAAEVAPVASDCDVGGMTFHDTAEQCCSALGEMSIHPECEDENSFDAECMRIVCDFCDGCSDSGDAQLQQATANCEMLTPYCPSSNVLAVSKLEKAQVSTMRQSLFGQHVLV